MNSIGKILKFVGVFLGILATGYILSISLAIHHGTLDLENAERMLDPNLQRIESPDGSFLALIRGTSQLIDPKVENYDISFSPHLPRETSFIVWDYSIEILVKNQLFEKKQWLTTIRNVYVGPCKNALEIHWASGSVLHVRHLQENTKYSEFEASSVKKVIAGRNLEVQRHEVPWNNHCEFDQHSFIE
jgi:hypothetical protein